MVYFRGLVTAHRGRGGGRGLRCYRHHRRRIPIGCSAVMLRGGIIPRPALICCGIGRRKTVIESESSTTGVVW